MSSQPDLSQVDMSKVSNLSSYKPRNEWKFICGFDDISWASISQPSLSSVRQQSHQMGVEAARMLLEMVKHDAPPRELMLSVSLQVRDTSRSS